MSGDELSALRRSVGCRACGCDVRIGLQKGCDRDPVLSCDDVEGLVRAYQSREEEGALARESPGTIIYIGRERHHDWLGETRVGGR